MTKRTSQGLDDKRRRERERYARLTPEQRRRWAKTQRDAKLKREYGITQQDYDAMMRAQCSTCAICYESLIRVRAHIDHDHDTGKVRAILCSACNRGIGYLRDSPEIVRRAALYLKGIRDYN